MFVDWNAGEPNDAGSGEDYVQLQLDGKLANAIDAYSSFRVICEQPSDLNRLKLILFVYSAASTLLLVMFSACLRRITDWQ